MVADLFVDQSNAVNTGNDQALTSFFLNSFPTTCYGLYHATHNVDGYTYSCDKCLSMVNLPWVSSYTSPVALTSATLSAAEGETFAFVQANLVDGETIVITRTYTKSDVYDNSTPPVLQTPADSYTDTMTIRMYTNNAAAYCP